MRAGALAFRDDLSPAKMRAESEVLRDAANAALRELRSVLRVLRDPSSSTSIENPQPTYTDIAGLVADARDQASDWSASPNVSGVVNPDRDLHPVGRAELLEDVRHVRFDGRDGHEQFSGDVGVRQTTPDGDGDLELAVSQRADPIASVGIGRLDPGPADVVDDDASGPWRQHRVTGCDRLDRADDLGWQRIFHEKPIGTGRQ